MTGINQWFNWRVVNVIRDHSMKSILFSSGACVTLSLSLALTLLVLGDTLQTISSGYLTVLFEPFVLPLIGFGLFGGLLVSVTAAVSLAREREMGTMETLFYGPVRHQDYVLGKFAGHWLAYIVLLLVFLGACLILSGLTELQLSTTILPLALLSAFAVAALIGLGILIATIARTTRATVLLFGGLILLFLILQAGETILTSIVSSERYMNLLFLRDSLSLVNGFFVRLSPTFYLMSGLQAILNENWSEASFQIVVMIIYMIVALTLSSSLLRQKEVAR